MLQGHLAALALPGTCSQSLPHMFSFPEFLPALAHFSFACPSHLLSLTQRGPARLWAQVWLTGMALGDTGMALGDQG